MTIISATAVRSLQNKAGNSNKCASWHVVPNRYDEFKGDIKKALRIYQLPPKEYRLVLAVGERLGLVTKTNLESWIGGLVPILSAEEYQKKYIFDLANEMKIKLPN